MYYIETQSGCRNVRRAGRVGGTWVLQGCYRLLQLPVFQDRLRCFTFELQQQSAGNRQQGTCQSVLPSHWRDRHQANDFCRGSGHQSDMRLFFPDLLKELKGMSSNVTGALSYRIGVNYIQRLKPQQGILVQRISFPKGGSIISWTSLQSDQNLRCPRIVWPCPISAANRPHVSAAVDRRDRQTKGRALDRFIISHTMRNA